MCDFFSAIVTRDHRVLFTEKDSHETIIARAGLTDTLLHGRAWVRVELRPTAEGWGPLVVDETTIPGWWDPVTDGDRVRVVADRVRGLYATSYAARAAAHATSDATRTAAWATYEATVTAAWATYQAAWAAAQATYETVIRTMDGYVPALSS